MAKKASASKSGFSVSKNAWMIAGIVIVVAALGLISFWAGNPSGFSVLMGENSFQPASNTVSPTSYAVRQQYFEEVFRPRRNEYHLFQQASDFLKISISQVPAYFDLQKESDIFADLPAVAPDFSETAYLLASGKLFSIGLLDENYYKEPEFYPGFKDNGLKYWTQPDPKYWGVNGYGTYPAEQSDILIRGQREDFTAIVFFYASWGVQTYQGVTISPTSETSKYFDVSVSPQTFLLEPTFPKFYKNWAQRVVITGKLKPDTNSGNYTLGFNVIVPPKESVSVWQLKYKSLYYDAASSFSPAGYPVSFNIEVQ
ncbi:MAG: hypothetical protein V1847_03120 [Candidatus Diapherotrites archaeon]